MNQVMVVHQVQHDFDQNVIVIMKLMKSKQKKKIIIFYFIIYYLVHNDEINIIHIKHQLILMKMLMNHFMMKINSKLKSKNKKLLSFVYLIEHQVNHQHQILVRINFI